MWSMSSMLEAPSGVMGAQRPRLWSGPVSALSEGARVARIADAAQLHLDDWERWVLDEGLGRREDRMWAAFEVCLIVARQNGKGAILEALELAALFIDDFGVDLILHSAHEFKTAAEAFRRIAARIDMRPELRKRVLHVHRQRGDEAIELRNGKRLRFVARTAGSGRGFTADLIILDEAYALGNDEMAALLPTLSSRPNPQLWYTSTAGNQKSLKLGSLRKRGLAGDPSLAFFEWSAGERLEDVDLDDPAAWAMANPGMGIRITEEYIGRERAAMLDDPLAFGRERLSIGDYPVEDLGWSVIPADRWDARIVPAPEVKRRPFAFAADASPGQVSAAIAVASYLADGSVLVEVPEGDHRPETGWVLPRLAELRSRYRSPVVIDPRGPASGLIADAEKMGMEIIKPALGEAAAAFAQFTTGVLEPDGVLRHLGQPELTAALKGATFRDTGDGGKLWARRDTSTDISPLVAVTLAQWALRKHGRAYDVLKSVAPPT
jgi:hypothetical protein